MNSEVTFKTLRDEIAIAAMQSALVNKAAAFWYQGDLEKTCQVAYEWADAMLAARDAARGSHE